MQRNVYCLLCTAKVNKIQHKVLLLHPLQPDRLFFSEIFGTVYVQFCMRIIHSLLVKSYCKFECGAVTATVDWFYTVFNVEYCNSVKVSIYIFFCFIFIHLLFSVSNWLSYILSMHAFSVSGRLTYMLTFLLCLLHCLLLTSCLWMSSFWMFHISVCGFQSLGLTVSHTLIVFFLFCLWPTFIRFTFFLSFTVCL